MKTRFEWLLILAAASGAVCAENKLQVPVAGFVGRANPTAVQPVLGLPGSVVLGSPISLPAGVKKLAVSGSTAIAELDGAPEAVIFALDSTVASSPQSISGAMPHWDLAAFSNTGSSAALYSAAAGRIQVVSGVRSVPSLSWTVDATTQLTAIAVSDDGRSVLTGLSDGTVWLFTSGQDPKKLLDGGNPVSLKFLGSGTDALVTDRALKQVIFISPSGTRVLASDAQGLTGPSDAELSADGMRAWIADDAGLFIVQADSGTTDQQSVPFAPAMLMRTGSTGVFLVLSEKGDSSGIWAPDSSSKQLWQFPAYKPE